MQNTTEIRPRGLKRPHRSSSQTIIPDSQPHLPNPPGIPGNRRSDAIDLDVQLSTPVPTIEQPPFASSVQEGLDNRTFELDPSLDLSSLSLTDRAAIQKDLAQIKLDLAAFKAEHQEKEEERNNDLHVAMKKYHKEMAENARLRKLLEENGIATDEDCVECAQDGERNNDDDEEDDEDDIVFEGERAKDGNGIIRKIANGKEMLGEHKKLEEKFEGSEKTKRNNDAAVEFRIVNARLTMKPGSLKWQ